MVVDVFTELAKECVLCELVYADDLVLMSDTIKGFRNKLEIWKESFKRKCLKILWLNQSDGQFLVFKGCLV